MSDAILDFRVRLYGGSEMSKHLSKCLSYGCEKHDPKVSEEVCKRDWHNGKSYLFLTCENLDSVCKNLDTAGKYASGL